MHVSVKSKHRATNALNLLFHLSKVKLIDEQ